MRTVKIFVPANSRLHISDLGKTFLGPPSVSLTGPQCLLLCKHCNAKILHNMMSIKTPQELIRLAEEVRERGFRSILISGGSNEKGQVPFEMFIDAIKHIKKLGLRVYMHTGLVDEYRAQLLGEAKVDVVLMDFVVVDKIIREALNLSSSAEDFVNSIKNLIKFSVEVVPHIVIGIYCGKPSGEKRAIDVLAELSPKVTVFVAFVPLPGTPYANCSPPSPDHIVDVLSYAKAKLTNVVLSYGCMRPRGERYQEVEMRVIDMGFDGLTLPSYSTIEYIIQNGIPFIVFQDCCAYLALEN